MDNARAVLRSVIVATLFVAAMSAPVAAKVSLESFAADPAMSAPKISPNGKHVAAPTRGKEDMVVVFDVDAPAGTKAGGIPMPKDVEIDWVEWANDDRLLIGVSKRDTTRYMGRTYDMSVSRVAAVDRNGKNFVTLFSKSRRFTGRYRLSAVTHPLPDDPKSVLMGAIDRDGRYNLFRVNVYDGKAELVQRGTDLTFQWLTDLAGVPRVRWDYRARGERIEIYLRKGDGDQWDMVAKYGERELPDLNIVAIADDPKIAIVASRESGDRYALFEYDMAARKLGKPLFQHPSVDVGEPVGGALFDPLTTRLIGVHYVEDVLRQNYFEPDLARVQDKLDATFASSAIVRLLSWSQDRSRLIVLTSGPKDPGTFYLYDAKQDRASSFGRRHNDIPAPELGDMLIIKYKARDGTRIPGYVTMPPGKGGKNLPMIVMPHGGPETRDFVQYDHWAQMLANRGYVVFQPNFRGSGGYGRAFAEAGHRQWGRRMQDDVTDGVQALIADGTADAGRICIVGASYGGYAALAGGAFTPDLYKCIVAIAGVSDIPEIIEEEEAQHTTESATYAYWVKRLGDPRYDLAQMKAVSPALHAQNFKAPVLLIHGEHDDIVPVAQSRRMEKALRAAGKPVQLVEIDDEGHHFEKVESDLKLMTELERFVAAHIGN